MSTSISTKMGQNALSLRDLQAVAPVLFTARNFQGRLLPMHVQSAPGGGKTAGARMIALGRARARPGVPFGYGVHNLGNSTPADIAGFTLFDSHRFVQANDDGTEVEVERKVSRFTVPTIFAFSVVYIADSDGFVESIYTDDFGQPLYAGAMVRGQPLVHGLILLDEFMQADVENRKVVAPLLDEGRVATHHLPPGIAVWAASNRATDKSGTGKAMAFLTNRQCGITLRPDFAGFMAYAEGRHDALPVTEMGPLAPLDHRGRANKRLGWHPAMLAFARGAEDLMDAGVPNDPGEPFLTRRSANLVANVMDAMMVHPDDSPVLFESDPNRARCFTALASGIMGDNNASQLNTTIALFDEIPTLAEVEKDPKGARVSQKKDAQLIASYVVGNAMDPRNGEAFCIYLKRLGDVFYKNAMVNAATRNGNLLSVPAMSAMFANDPSAITRMMNARANAERITAQREKQGHGRR
jgi:hypothetical protein